MNWRVAKSLLTLRDQINDLAPTRSKTSDGAVGDAAHASRASDHNPHVNDGTMGVVTALDITHDPANGVDAGKLAEALRVSGDPRIKYIISNRRIAAPGQPWRAYTGSNPHTRHFHVSVKPAQADYDSEQPWEIGDLIPELDAGPVRVRPTLRIGSVGEDVRFLQRQLKTPVDGDFGSKTEAALKAFQDANGIPDDGVCGPYTWDAIESKAGKLGVPIRVTKPVKEAAKSSRTVFGSLATLGTIIGGFFKDSIEVVMEAAAQIETLSPAMKLSSALGITTSRFLFAAGIASIALVIYAKWDDTVKGAVAK